MICCPSLQCHCKGVCTSGQAGGRGICLFPWETGHKTVEPIQILDELDHKHQILYVCDSNWWQMKMHASSLQPKRVWPVWLIHHGHSWLKYAKHGYCSPRFEMASSCFLKIPTQWDLPRALWKLLQAQGKSGNSTAPHFHQQTFTQTVPGIIHVTPLKFHLKVVIKVNQGMQQ